MRHTFFIPAAVAALCLAVAPAPVAEAQEPTSVFGEQIEVRVVNLEVVVEDRDGNRVSGLGLGDFRLRVDGDEVPIDYFTEVADGRRAEPVPALLEEGGPEPRPIGGTAEPGERVGTNYLVFIDDFFTLSAEARNQVIDETVGSLSLLGPGDRMAVVAFDGRKVELLSEWTRAPSLLRSAFERAKARPARGIRIRSALGDFDNVNRIDLEEEPTGGGGPLAIGDDTLTASSREARACASIMQIEKFLERETLAVTSTLRSFSAPPGRKVALLLAGGWPSDAYDYILGPTQPGERTGECGHRGGEILAPMYEVANLLGYTLYPVDVPGRSARMLADASEPDDVALARTGPGLEGPGEDLIVPFESVRESETQLTLSRLAHQTGGRALLDAARLDSFDEVVADTRSYYWLGFTPEWQGDDRNHEIRLEVLKPGLEVRHREGYQDLSRDKEMTFLVESALLFGELQGSYPLRVELGAPSGGRRKVELPLYIRIPMDAVTMLPHDGRYVAELELRIGALDEHGDRNEIAAIPVRLEGEEPPPLGSYATYETAIKIRRDPQDLAITLRDPATDTVLAAITRFEP